MPNPAIETHLDNVFANGAAETAKHCRNKKFMCTLLNRNFQPTEKFECEILSVYYDKPNDGNVYHIKRLSDGKEFSKLQFFIELKEL